MKNSLTLILLLLFPLLLSARGGAQEPAWTQNWNKQFSSASDIIKIYQQNARNHPQDKLLNNCFMVFKSGEYVIASKGEASDISELVKETPDIDLENPVTCDFMTHHTADLFADFCFMFKAMKEGAPFNEARSGLGFSTTFLPRPLNQYDYSKLHQIFSGKNEKLKLLYLEILKFVFRGNGCSDESLKIKPVIQQKVADSELKKEILQLYFEYEQLRRGQPAPHVIFKDMNDKEYSFKDFKGKVIVVDIWATWCYWCLKKMPLFMQLRNEYQGNDNIVFLAVSVDVPSVREKWLKAIQDHKMDGMFNLIRSGSGETDFQEKYRVGGIPRYLLIDHKGNIINAFISSVGPELKQDIEKALAEIPPTGGTEWQDLTLQQALQKSAATGKKIFIDCYTKTCSPCKYMVKSIFPLKKCGDYFNSNYICLMRDIEEGEGIEIGRKYKTAMYPTYLILNSDGTEYCRLIGGVNSPEEDFVARVKDVIRLAEYNEKYTAGLRDQVFIREYITLMKKYDSIKLKEVLGQLMPPMGVTKLCQPENWELMQSAIYTPNLPLFQYLLKNRKTFEKILGEKEIHNKITSAYTNEFYMYRGEIFDIDKRIAEVKKLEKQGCLAITPLKYSMIFWNIVTNRLDNRADEILAILENGLASLPEQDQLKVLRELFGFENIATPSQKQRAITSLKQISQQISPFNVGIFNKMTERLSQN